MSALALRPTYGGDKLLARALAVAMHVLFFVLLVVGVSWQKEPVEVVTADLWSSLPTPPQTASQPKAEPEEEPEPPKPVPRVKPPPAPKAEAKPPRVETKPEPKPALKPDIAIPKKEKEPPKAEPKKREDDKAVREQKAAEAREREREREREMKKILDAEREADAKAAAEKAARAAAAAKAAAPTVVSGDVQRYINGIRDKVRSRYAAQPDHTGAGGVEFTVMLLPGGELRDVVMRKSSGNPAYDAAVERAIRSAQPFQVPSGEEFQRFFSQMTLSLRPDR